VLFEAFAAGLPVVATAVGSVSEAGGDAILLVPPGDADAPAASCASSPPTRFFVPRWWRRPGERPRAHS
jgi:hypothetical protein